MAFLLGCEKVDLEFATKEVLRGVSLGIDEGDRIGIVGRNGEGKSTLLSLLAGAQLPDAGRVIKSGSVSVGLLGQSDTLDENCSVGKALVADMPAYQWAGDGRIREILEGLTRDIAWDASIKTLSGGERRRVDLARLLIGEWDVLALDEPTNHLDMPAITWLANHLKGRWRRGQGALLVVTHDRWFLDEVCLRMWEVHNCQVDLFAGGYAAYVMARVERERLAAAAQRKHQNALRRELAWLSRGARARATKPKFHVAQAEQLIADVPPLRNDLELKRMAMARLGKQVVDLKQVTVHFEGEPYPVIEKLDWSIGPGDRFGILGANGSGKTTLLKVIQGILQPSSGVVKIGKTVRFAVLSQHMDTLKQGEGYRVRQVIGRYSRRLMLDGKELTPAQLLERLGFGKADLNEMVQDLSGGQKRRLALMLILLNEPNVLILDEPGNDLDTDMLAAMEDLLDSWPGTLLLVTHDRYLMERVSDHQFVLSEGKLTHLPKGVEDYLERYANNLPSKKSMSGSHTASARVPTKPRAGKNESTDASRGLTGGQQRTVRKALQSNERRRESLQTQIDALQARMHEVAASDYIMLGSLHAEIETLKGAVSALEEEWLEAAAKLEA